MRHRSLVAAALAACLSSPAAGGPDRGYRTEVEAWRSQRQARLTAEGGWLSLVGLFWLQEGANPFGADPAGTVVLPPGTAPARAGAFELRGARVSVSLEPGVEASFDGRPARAGEMRSDADPSPTVLGLGRLTLHLIERGGRLAIRVKDPQSEARTSFKGLAWFPVDESWRVRAHFVRYDQPRSIKIPNVLGQVESMPSPGYATFQRGGRELRLEPVLETPGARELFFIFRDGTSGKETYGAGRFLYAPMPGADGTVVLDFNKAYTPPCGFTPYATCPLPPPQNRLPLRVEAGEKHHPARGH